MYAETQGGISVVDKTDWLNKYWILGNKTAYGILPESVFNKKKFISKLQASYVIYNIFMIQWKLKEKYSR